LAYEVFHWCEHVPKGRWFERTRWFQFLLEHHRIHHKYARKNYNVVLPLGDLLFGTLSLDRLPPEPPEPVIPERIKSWLGGGSRRCARPQTPPFAPFPRGCTAAWPGWWRRGRSRCGWRSAAPRSRPRRGAVPRAGAPG